MNNKVGFIACILGWTAIAMGAFATHGLSDQLSAEALHTVHTAFEYQLIHAVVMLWLSRDRTLGLGSAVVLCFGVGIFLFSGSLYLLALMHLSSVGMITPIGGTALLLGWFLLGLRCLKTTETIR